MKIRMMLGAFLLASVGAFAAAKHNFTVSGMFVEGCSCKPPCTCEMTELEGGCQGVGADVFSGGSYNGTSLAGGKVAYATEPGKWVRLFIQAKSPKQRKGLEAFARAMYSAFGPIESVKDAKIAFSGKNGTHLVMVDGGSVMSLSTKPILGGDNRTALKYSNTKDMLHPTVWQGKTLKGSYNDGDHNFTLADSNSYFSKFTTKGKA